MKNVKAIEALLEITNQNLGYEPSSPAEFTELSLMIFKKVGKDLSVSSLKRLWGYVNYDNNPSTTTLNILARFNGLDSWSAFLDYLEDQAIDDSGFSISSFVNTDTMSPGDVLKLEWGIDKGCDIKCIGPARFEVLKAQNIKLQAGDRLTLHTLCKGHPICATNIERGSDKLPAYMGAKKSGLRELILQAEENSKNS